MPTPYDILISLHEMFGAKGWPARQTALKIILDIKTSEGTPIRDHMICMIRIFNEMDILGVEIHGKI